MSLPQRAKVWIGGQVVDGSQAMVPVFDRGLLYGDSVYEVTRTVGGVPLFLAEHLRRLSRSAAGIEMDLPPEAQIRAALAAALAALREEAYVRIVVTRGAGEISLDPAAADAPRLIVIVKPLQLPADRLYEEGALLCLCDWRRNAPGHVPAAVKSGNYLSSVMAVVAARRAGAYEALLCDPAGHIAEGASSNIFWVRGGRLHTPPESLGILPGITRQVVLRLAAEAALPSDEALLRPAELGGVSEAFLTSSVRGLVPVVRVDDVVIGDGRPGPLTRRLMDLYSRHIGHIGHIGHFGSGPAPSTPGE